MELLLYKQFKLILNVIEAIHLPIGELSNIRTLSVEIICKKIFERVTASVCA